jgi:two-component system, LytTR family, sensor kinase
VFYVWIPLTPLVIWLGRRFPLERKRIFRNLLILTFLMAPVVILHMRLLECANILFLNELRINNDLSPLRVLFLKSGAFAIMVYWSILAVSHALTYFRKYQEREVMLAQAQLHALKAQLHPHFIFNTLNAISELVYDAPERAERTIAQLSELLRLSLRGGRQQEVSLKGELDFLRTYVEVQQTLMQERLAVRWDVEPETLDALVPDMILQPLVENSIRHGIAPLARGGRIDISAKRSDGMLLLEVRDNGAGVGAGSKVEANEGVGLSNVRERLAHLYGGEHRFEMSEPPGGGTAVSIILPFRESEGGTDEDTYAHS